MIVSTPELADNGDSRYASVMVSIMRRDLPLLAERNDHKSITSDSGGLLKAILVSFLICHSIA